MRLCLFAAPLSSTGPEIGGGPEDVAESSELKSSHGSNQDNVPLSLSSNIRCFVFPRADITRFKSAR